LVPAFITDQHEILNLQKQSSKLEEGHQKTSDRLYSVLWEKLNQKLRNSEQNLIDQNKAVEMLEADLSAYKTRHNVLATENMRLKMDLMETCSDELRVTRESLATLTKEKATLETQATAAIELATQAVKEAHATVSAWKKEQRIREEAAFSKSERMLQESWDDAEALCIELEAVAVHNSSLEVFFSFEWKHPLNFHMNYRKSLRLKRLFFARRFITVG